MSLDMLTELKKIDSDRFFLTLFAKKDQREAIAAIYVLYHEVAKTPEVVNEKAMGQIRLQWWRDEIEKLFQDKERETGHPCLRSLCNVPRNDLLNIIDAHEKTLDTPSFQTIQSLEDYLLSLQEPVFNCVTKIGEQQHEIKSLALGWGMLQMIRSIPFTIPQGYHMFPVELLNQHGVTGGYLTPETKELKNIVRDLCERTESILNEVNLSKSHLKLYQKLAMLYLKNIQKHDYQIFLDTLHHRPPFSEWKLVGSFLLD